MLSCQKSSFSLPDTVHYLNCAYMAPLPKTTEQTGIWGIRRKRVPTDIEPSSFFTESDDVRRLFARLVHIADPQRVALLPSVSYGMAVVAKNAPVARGQNLVVAHEQFPSNVYTWRRLGEERGAELRTVAPPEAMDGRGRAWNEALLGAIDDDTAVVALGHVHWADGTKFDLERIGQRARSVGALLIIDGTQSVGALPFDVHRIQPDALICAGYKWLFGPYGIGVGYFGPRFDDGIPLEENWIHREGSEDFSGLVAYAQGYQPGAIRFDVGERSNPILLPMLRASLELVLGWGAANIQAYCKALSLALLEEARGLGFFVEDEAWRGSHLFGLRLPPGLNLNDVRDALSDRNVSVSVRGSAIRVSLNVYNDERDVAALREALRACVAASSTSV